MCTTYSGRAVYPTNLGVPTLEDIALSLSRMPRFAGHTRQPFSVLHHIRLCSRISEDLRSKLPPSHAAFFHAALLLHDAEESVLGDMPSTWKNAVPEVRRLYDSLNVRISTHYLKREIPEWCDDMISTVDILSLQAEMLEFAPYECWEHSGHAWFMEREALDDERRMAYEVVVEPADDVRDWFVATVSAELAVIEEARNERAGAARDREGEAIVAGIVEALERTFSGRDRAPDGGTPH